jgi:hypothetical protein
MPLMPLSYRWLRDRPKQFLSQLTAATLSYAAVCAIAGSSSFYQTLEVFESIISQHAISLASTLPDAFEDFLYRSVCESRSFLSASIVSCSKKPN